MDKKEALFIIIFFTINFLFQLFFPLNIQKNRIVETFSQKNGQSYAVELKKKCKKLQISKSGAVNITGQQKSTLL